MSSRDAYMFPLIGSAFLFSLYLLFKFLPAEYINLLVKAYFFCFGVLVLAANLEKIVELLVSQSIYQSLDREVIRFHLPWCFASKKKSSDEKDEPVQEQNTKSKDKKADKSPEAPKTNKKDKGNGKSVQNGTSQAANSSSKCMRFNALRRAALFSSQHIDECLFYVWFSVVFSFSKANGNGNSNSNSNNNSDENLVKLSLLDIDALLMALLVGVWYLKFNHWSASNIFGIAFSIQGIEYLSLGSFFNGAILLVQYFFFVVVV